MNSTGSFLLAPNGLAILEKNVIDEIYKYPEQFQDSMEFANKGLNTYINLDCKKLEKKHRFPIIAIARQDLLGYSRKSLKVLAGAYTTMSKPWDARKILMMEKFS